MAWAKRYCPGHVSPCPALAARRIDDRHRRTSSTPHSQQGSFIVNSSEVFFPAGWLALSSEQSAHIKSVLGKDVSAVPVYNVVSRGANSGYQPLNVVPGLACLVVHEDAYQQFDAQGGPLHALPDDLSRASHESASFGTDARSTARQGDDEAAKNAKFKQK
jgi:hypothetical protein